MSPEEIAVHQTVERYNMVNRFLNKITSPSDKEFAQHLLRQMVPQVQSSDLADLENLLEYVSKALTAARASQERHNPFKDVNDFIERIDPNDGLQEFAAYIAPRLLPDGSADEAEVKHLCAFIKKHVVKQSPLKPESRTKSHQDTLLDSLESDNLNAMLRRFAKSELSSGALQSLRQIDEKPLSEQASLIEEQVRQLEEVQRQLRELKGKDGQVDRQALAAYLATTAEAVRAIESALDKDEVSLPASELALLDLP